jgi:hypothetical protein
MQPFEAVVIAYLIFFVVAAHLSRAAPRQRWAVACVAGVVAAVVYAASHRLPLSMRLWLPFLYIAIGYWIPKPLVPPISGGAFESWLRRTDTIVRRRIDGNPGWLATALQLGYLACFPLVPAGFAVVWLKGSPEAVAEFWQGVLVAGFICYGSLPWLVSRPPRLIDDDAVRPAAEGVARLNRDLLGVVSHGLNTFPSGHVAVSVAVAIGAGQAWPGAGMILGVVAAMVAVGAFTGRYHYIADVVFGIVVGVAASL